MPITDLAARSTREQPIVVIDAPTGGASRSGPSSTERRPPPARALLIHPAKNLREGHRYFVALRNLRDADGALLQPSAAFRCYRDGIRPRVAPSRAPRRNGAASSRALEPAGVKRDELYLAWDFTVASARTLVGAAARIRDDAFAARATRTSPT